MYFAYGHASFWGKRSRGGRLICIRQFSSKARVAQLWGVGAAGSSATAPVRLRDPFQAIGSTPTSDLQECCHGSQTHLKLDEIPTRIDRRRDTPPPPANTLRCPVSTRPGPPQIPGPPVLAYSKGVVLAAHISAPEGHAARAGVQGNAGQPEPRRY